MIAYENRLLEESIDISINRHKESVTQTGQMHADFLHYYLIGSLRVLGFIGILRQITWHR